MTTIPKGIDISIRGQRFGHLVAEYATDTGRKVVLRCVCERLICAAAEALASGTVTSCGCQPASEAFHQQQSSLSQQLTREVTFGGGRPRNPGIKIHRGSKL
jgi:hypothetical protein